MGSRRALGAVCGVLAALAGLGAAEGVAALISGPSPIVAVGTWAIDVSPQWLSSWAIDTFGVDDKKILVRGMLLTVAALGALAGALGVTRRRAALALAAAIGLVGLLAVATVRGVDDPLPVLVAPALVALLVSTGGLAAVLAAIARRAQAPRPAGAEPAAGSVGVVERAAGPAAATPAAPAAERPAVMIPGRVPALAGVDRRDLLRAVGGLGALGLTGGALWQVKGTESNFETRGLVALPRPASPAPVVRRADFGLPGLSPYLTPNRDFYRIDTSLIVPRLDLRTWRLKIHGMVENPITLTYEDILAARLIERDVTLTCVSNEVGGYYAGNARWLGMPIAEVLKSARPLPGADAVRSTSVDGWTAGTPLGALTDPGRDAMFAIGMNGESLPYDHGFPVRMVVPGLYGFVSATKWVTDLEVTRFDEFEAYWTQRGWAEQGPIKTQTRLELPQPFTRFPAAATTIAGMAWAQHRGISKVEVLIDDGPWRRAELAPWDNVDTWRQWRLTGWRPDPGLHQMVVRATDGAGEVQTAESAATVPDGASGYHIVSVETV